MAARKSGGTESRMYDTGMLSLSIGVVVMGQMEKAVALLCLPCTPVPDLYWTFITILNTTYLVSSVYYV